MTEVLVFGGNDFANCFQCIQRFVQDLCLPLTCSFHCPTNDTLSKCVANKLVVFIGQRSSCDVEYLISLREGRNILFVDCCGEASPPWPEGTTVLFPHLLATTPTASGVCSDALLAMHIARWVTAQVNPPRKVLVLDCDNTLWGGVVGEVGPDCVSLTPAHVTLQSWAAALAEAGVVVCLATKNSEEDVRSVWAARGEEMPLKLDRHVAGIMAGWGRKSDSCARLSTDLALPLDSFVFIDDSPMEVQEVRVACPGVAAFVYPAGTDDVRAWLRHLWVFDTSASIHSWAARQQCTAGTGRSDEPWGDMPMPQASTAEDAARVSMYAAAFARTKQLATSSSYTAFLDSLQLVVSISPLHATDEAQVARVAQLTMRTNQMNAHKKPYSETELLALVQGGSHRVWTVSASDRFGDYGLVGAIAARTECVHLSSLTAEALDVPVVPVDMFLLSCRALSRGIEHGMVRTVAASYPSEGIGGIAICWTPSDRNEPMRAFLWGPDMVGMEPVENVALRSVHYPSSSPRLSLLQACEQAHAFLTRWRMEHAAALQEGVVYTGPKKKIDSVIAAGSGAILPDPIAAANMPPLDGSMRPKRPGCRFSDKCLRVGLDHTHTLAYSHAFLTERAEGSLGADLLSEATRSMLADDAHTLYSPAPWRAGTALMPLPGYTGGHALQGEACREVVLSMLLRHVLEVRKSAVDRAFLGATRAEDLGLTMTRAQEKPPAGWVFIPTSQACTCCMSQAQSRPVHSSSEHVLTAAPLVSHSRPSTPRASYDARGTLLHAWPWEGALEHIAYACAGYGHAWPPGYSTGIMEQDSLSLEERCDRLLSTLSSGCAEAKGGPMAQMQGVVSEGEYRRRARAAVLWGRPEPVGQSVGSVKQ